MLYILVYNFFTVKKNIQHKIKSQLWNKMAGREKKQSQTNSSTWFVKFWNSHYQTLDLSTYVPLETLDKTEERPLFLKDSSLSTMKFDQSIYVKKNPFYAFKSVGHSRPNYAVVSYGILVLRYYGILALNYGNFSQIQLRCYTSTGTVPYQTCHILQL